MHLEIGPRGVLQIDDARIIFRNFAGLGDKFNREGDRNFALVIPDMDTADTLRAAGWNVKVKPPREEGDEPFMFMPIKVKFNDRGPNVYLATGANQIKLEEQDIHMLDRVDILSVDMDVRPYDWDVNGKQGRTAYLQGMKVTQRVTDRFAMSAGTDEEELPFD